MELQKSHKLIDGSPVMYFVSNFYLLFEFLQGKNIKKIESCAGGNKKCTFPRDI